MLIGICTGLLKLVLSPNVRLHGEIFRDLTAVSRMPSLEIVLSSFFKLILEDVLVFSEKRA